MQFTRHQAWLCCLLWNFCGALAASCNNNQPLLGILSQPGEPATGNHSYIAASYIKFAESGGARVVPILHDTPADELEKLLHQLNGALIPGGGQDLYPGHTFFDTTQRLLQHAVEAGDRGEHWPLWGTCLGFEALAVAIARNSTLLGKYDSINMPAKLTLASDIDSKLLQGLPEQILQDMQREELIFQNHKNGIDKQRVVENPQLDEFVNVLAYSCDRKNVSYVSMFEAKKYPIFAVQFHPEKNAFEWAPFLAIPHNSKSISVTSAFAEFLVNEARCNDRAPKHPKTADSMLIYNYPAVYTGEARRHGVEADFEQCYFFPPWRQHKEIAVA